MGRGTRCGTQILPLRSLHVAVVWHASVVRHAEKRAESLRKAIAADTTLTDRLFVTTTPDRFLTTLLPHESTDA